MRTITIPNEDPPKCPHCGSAKSRGNGLNRRLCYECLREFRPITHPHKLLSSGLDLTCPHCTTHNPVSNGKTWLCRNPSCRKQWVKKAN